jgi:hypothetical protein
MTTNNNKKNNKKTTTPKRPTTAEIKEKTEAEAIAKIVADAKKKKEGKSFDLVVKHGNISDGAGGEIAISIELFSIKKEVLKVIADRMKKCELTNVEIYNPVDIKKPEHQREVITLTTEHIADYNHNFRSKKDGTIWLKELRTILREAREDKQGGSQRQRMNQKLDRVLKSIESAIAGYKKLSTKDTEDETLKELVSRLSATKAVILSLCETETATLVASTEKTGEK